MAGFRLRLGKVPIAQGDVFAFAVFVPFDDLVPIDFLAGLFIDPPVANPGKVALVEQIEIEAFGRLRRVEPDRNIDQSEIDAARPDRPGRALSPGFLSRVFFAGVSPRHDRNPTVPGRKPGRF